MILLCSVICLQPSLYAAPEKAATVVVNSDGKTAKQKRSDARMVRNFYCANATALAITFCLVSRITGSRNVGVMASGALLSAMARSESNIDVCKDTLLCRYGEDIGFAAVCCAIGRLCFLHILK